MRSFPNDDLDPAQTSGDLLLALCAGSADTAIHALREIAKHTRGGIRVCATARTGSRGGCSTVDPEGGASTGAGTSAGAG